MLPNSLKGGKTILTSVFLSRHPVTVCLGLKFKKRTSVPYLSCQIPSTNSGICTASLASGAAISKVPFGILLARIAPAGNSNSVPKTCVQEFSGKEPQEDTPRGVKETRPGEGRNPTGISSHLTEGLAAVLFLRRCFRPRQEGQAFFPSEQHAVQCMRPKKPTLLAAAEKRVLVMKKRPE